MLVEESRVQEHYDNYVAPYQPKFVNRQTSRVPGLIVFTLYGNHPNYVLGLLQNVKDAQRFYPGWRVRVYTEPNHYSIDRLIGLGAEVATKYDYPRNGFGPMGWRLLAADDELADVIIFRDADSRFSEREVASVREWIKSGKSLHSIRDHKAHMKRPICGGLWGIRAGKLRDMFDLKTSWVRSLHGTSYGEPPYDTWGFGRYGADEAFLQDKVWPRFRDDCLVHDSLSGNSATDFCGKKQLIRLQEIAPERISLVCLNPDKYPDRWQQFQQYLSRSTLLSRFKLERFAGLPSNSPDLPPVPDNWRYKKPTQAHYWAATVAHGDIVAEAFDQGRDLLIIFEDDATIEPSFDQVLSRAWESLPWDWKGLYLGSHVADRPAVPVKGRGSVMKLRGQLSAHAIIMNRAGMKSAMRKIFEEDGAPRTVIDKLYSEMHAEEPGWYGTSPWISHQTSRFKTLCLPPKITATVSSPARAEWIAPDPDHHLCVMTGCDSAHEDLLSPWYEALRRHCGLPVVFVDVGLSTEARQWCEQRGQVVTVHEKFDHPFLFKLSAIIRSSYRATMWIDPDARVQASIDRAFDHLTDGKQIAIAFSNPAFKIDHVNTGVMVIAHESEIIREGAQHCTIGFRTGIEDIQRLGDQAVLNWLRRRDGDSAFAYLPPEFNWTNSRGARSDVPIMHYNGADAKAALRLRDRSDCLRPADYRIPVITTISRCPELWPHFLKHYAAIGAGQVHVITFGADRLQLEHALRELTPSGLPGDFVEIVQGEAYEHYPAVSAAMYGAISRLTAPGEWYCVADLDEFCEFPQPLPMMAQAADSNGWTHYQGTFIDRFARGGILASVQSDPPIWEQYPMGAKFSQYALKLGWEKVNLIKNPILPSNSGHHRTYDGVCAPGVYQVHHFKWTSSIRETIEARRDRIVATSSGPLDENRRLLQYLDKSNGVIRYPMKELGMPVGLRQFSSQLQGTLGPS